MLKRIALMALIAVPAQAQQQPLTPDELLDLAQGKTLTFVLAQDGSVVGIERFLGRERTVWAQPNGRCAYGDVEVRGEKLCFFYDDEPAGVGHCWTTYAEAGVPHVQSTDNGEIQRVDAITREYVGCDGEPLS
jgi:hypothetical protein